MGLSKRVPHIPRGFDKENAFILFAHPQAVRETIKNSGDLFERDTYKPGIFLAVSGAKVEFEVLLYESEATPDVVQHCEKRGIKVVLVPDGDVDHY